MKRYCISCRTDHTHYWNEAQHSFECDECGLLALDETRRPDPIADAKSDDLRYFIKRKPLSMMERTLIRAAEEELERRGEK